MSNESPAIILDPRILLTDCSIYWNSHILSLGDIAAERIEKVRLPGKRNKEKPFEVPYVRAGDHPLMRKSVQSLFDNVKPDLSKDLIMAIHENYQKKTDRLCFFGWMTTNLMEITESSAPLKGHHVSFLQWEITIR